MRNKRHRLGFYQYPLDKGSRDSTFEVPEETKFEHTWILAGPGSGKTTLFYKEILDNLDRPDPPAMVIIDPKGTMMRTLSRLAIFDPDTGTHRDRLILIDLNDFDHPPALNMFHPADEARFASYGQRQRQQVINTTINLLTYAFDSRENGLTAQQATCFENVCRLMFTLPETPTIQDVLNLLGENVKHAENSQWYPHIQRLEPVSRQFFMTKYFAEWKSTRQGVETRIYGILKDPLVATIFSARKRRVDMFRYLQERKTIIINVPIGLLLPDSAQLLARYMLAVTLAAAFERLTIPRDQWTPAFVFVDEFQEVADETKSPQLLRMAREYRLGMYIANQDVEALPSRLRSAMSAATTTKYASALGGVDLSFMARDMRTSPDTLAAVTPDKKNAIGKFACYVRGTTPKPVEVTIPFGAVEKLPTMPESAHRKLTQRSRSIISQQPEHRPHSTKPPNFASTKPPPLDDDAPGSPSTDGY